MQKKQASIPKQQKMRTARPSSRRAARLASTQEASGLLTLQSQLGNRAMQRQLAQRKKAARPGINPLDPAVMEAAARGVIAQNEAPVRHWLAANTNRLRLLTMDDLVAQVRRNVPAASDLDDGEIQSLAREWATLHDITIPEVPVIPPVRPLVQLPDAVKKAFSVPIEGVELVNLPGGKLNIAVRGATAKLGRTEIKLGWSGSLGIDVPIKGFELAGELNKDSWKITLATPGASSIPDLTKLAQVFREGEAALRSMVAATARLGKLNNGAEIKAAIGPQIGPLKEAVQTLVDLADVPTMGANISLSGPTSGKEGGARNASPSGITVTANVVIKF